MTTLISVVALGVNDPPRYPDPPPMEHLVAPETEFVIIEKGMASGRSSVMMRVARPDGSWVVVEWSMAALNMALHAALAFSNRFEAGL